MKAAMTVPCQDLGIVHRALHLLRSLTGAHNDQVTLALRM